MLDRQLIAQSKDEKSHPLQLKDLPLWELRRLLGFYLSVHLDLINSGVQRLALLLGAKPLDEPINSRNLFTALFPWFPVRPRPGLANGS